MVVIFLTGQTILINNLHLFLTPLSILDGFDDSGVRPPATLPAAISLRTRHGWNFFLLAANTDAVKLADSYAIKPGSALTFGANAKGQEESLHAMSASLQMLRMQGGKAREFTATERKLSMGSESTHRSV